MPAQYVYVSPMILRAATIISQNNISLTAYVVAGLSVMCKLNLQTLQEINIILDLFTLVCYCLLWIYRKKDM